MQGDLNETISTETAYMLSKKYVESAEVNGLCLFEKDTEVTIARIALDLELIGQPEFSDPNDSAPVNLSWPVEFVDENARQTLASLLFAFLAVQQRKEDGGVIVTVAMSRLLTHLKKIYAQ